MSLLFHRGAGLVRLAGCALLGALLALAPQAAETAGAYR